MPKPIDSKWNLNPGIFCPECHRPREDFMEDDIHLIKYLLLDLHKALLPNKNLGDKNQ